MFWRLHIRIWGSYGMDWLLYNQFERKGNSIFLALKRYLEVMGNDWVPWGANMKSNRLRKCLITCPSDQLWGTWSSSILRSITLSWQRCRLSTKHPFRIYVFSQRLIDRLVRSSALLSVLLLSNLSKLSWIFTEVSLVFSPQIVSTILAMNRTIGRNKLSSDWIRAWHAWRRGSLSHFHISPASSC